MRLLLVEDTYQIGRFLSQKLTKNFVVDWMKNGKEGIHSATIQAYGIIILDVGLPDISGFTVCKALRQRRIHTPIIFLSGHNSLENKIEGFDAGADDYLCKPFEIQELLSRIDAVLRRQLHTPSEFLQIKNLRLDSKTSQVFYEEVPVCLEKKEFLLLKYLMLHAGKVIPKLTLWEQIWRSPECLSSNIVETYISKLRKKIDQRFGVKIISTVYKAGYIIQK